MCMVEDGKYSPTQLCASVPFILQHDVKSVNN